MVQEWCRSLSSLLDDDNDDDENDDDGDDVQENVLESVSSEGLSGQLPLRLERLIADTKT